MYIPLPINPLISATIGWSDIFLWFVFQFSKTTQNIGMVSSKPVGLTKAAANEQKITTFHCSFRSAKKQKMLKAKKRLSA